MRRTPLYLPDPLSELGLALLVLSSALLLGSVYASAVGVMAIAAGLLAAFTRPPTHLRTRARRLIGLGVVLALYTGLTLLPWPRTWLEALAPQQAWIGARALSGFGEPPLRWVTLSLDPAATRIELAKLLTYAAVFHVALAITERRRGSTSLERIVLACAAAVALLSLGHWAMGETSVFGWYTPDVAKPARHVSVFLNPNQLASYLVIGACFATGVLTSSRPAVRRATAVAVLALCALGTALAASRAGLALLLLGVGFVVLASRVRGKAPAQRMLVLGLLLLCSLVVSVLALSEEVRAETADTDLTKLDIFRQALPLVSRYGVLGIGRGAYEAVSAQTRTDLGAFVFTHPENVGLQLAIEWGLPVTLLVLGVLALSLAPGALRGRAVPPLGAYGALLVFALHNLVDFGTELVGLMVPVVLAVALVVGGSRASAPRTAAPARVGWSFRAVASLAVLLGALTVATADHELFVEMRALTHQVGQAGFLPRLRAASLRHPAEAHFAYLGALHTSQTGGSSVLPWVARTLTLSPVHGRAHLLLARELESRNPAQARLEYRLAIAQDGRALPAYDARAPRLVGSWEQALELVPDTRDAPRLGEEAPSPAVLARLRLMRDAALLRLAQSPSLAERLPATSTRLLELAAAHGNAAAHLLLARRSLRDAVEHRAWCPDDASCLEVARAHVASVLDAAPHDTAALVLDAEILAVHRPDEALDALLGHEHVCDDREALFTAAARMAVRAPTGTAASARAGELVDTMLERSCTGPAACARVLTTAIELTRQRKDPHRVLVLLRRLTERAPGDAEAWRSRAALARELGLYSEALASLDELLLLRPLDPASLAEREQVRAEQLRRGTGAP